MTSLLPGHEVVFCSARFGATATCWTYGETEVAQSRVLQWGGWSKQFAFTLCSQQVPAKYVEMLHLSTRKHATGQSANSLDYKIKPPGVEGRLLLGAIAQESLLESSHP